MNNPFIFNDEENASAQQSKLLRQNNYSAVSILSLLTQNTPVPANIKSAFAKGVMFNSDARIMQICPDKVYEFGQDKVVAKLAFLMGMLKNKEINSQFVNSNFSKAFKSALFNKAHWDEFTNYRTNNYKDFTNLAVANIAYRDADAGCEIPVGLDMTKVLDSIIDGDKPSNFALHDISDKDKQELTDALSFHREALSQSAFYMNFFNKDIDIVKE